jgi:4-hydroxybenzoate polyprenyltransferase
LKIFNFSFLYPDMKKNHFSSQILLKFTFSRTPLFAAAWGGNIEMTKVLVEAGAPLSAVDYKVIKPSVKLIK